jgi:hypothetical protein
MEYDGYKNWSCARDNQNPSFAQPLVVRAQKVSICCMDVSRTLVLSCEDK